MSSSPSEPRRSVYITGIGRALPGEPVSNQKLLHYCNLGVSEQWAVDKVGIRFRHVSKQYPDSVDSPNAPSKAEWMQWGPKEGCRNSDLACQAAQMALANAGIQDVQQVDMIVVSTCTPDYPVPATATLVQEKLGVLQCLAMDIRSACTGSTLGLLTAVNALKQGEATIALCIGSEVGSVFGSLDKDLDPSFSKGDAVNALMIGDGAGCVVLQYLTEHEALEQVAEHSSCRMRNGENSSENGLGIFEVVRVRNRSAGCGKPPGMYLPAGGSNHPCSQVAIDQGLHKFKHNFRDVIEHGPELYVRALEQCEKDLAPDRCLNDVSVFVPHQANGKVVELATKMKLPTNRIFLNFSTVGNTANASIPLCLADMMFPRPKALPDSSPDLLCANLPKDALVLALTAESTKWLWGYALFRFVRCPPISHPLGPPLYSNWIVRLVFKRLLWPTVKTIIAIRRMVLDLFPRLCFRIFDYNNGVGKKPTKNGGSPVAPKASS